MKDILNARISEQQNEIATLSRKYEDLKTLVMEMIQNGTQEKAKVRKLPPALSVRSYFDHLTIEFDLLSKNDRCLTKP